ncbi:hypothetical protein Fleli_3107 [Bernardetia litoralis DSM 6794]|uniref:Uncharacterized protein n=1 Tax=Bernardetia litoralis (strain ATCC 23117 / DSM 6794 / NBRC 15988 / NCIMB 1366 / Fx l1 / Sio-4) TaxID=880071 RepID=I4ANB2_BERLS|nr:hypothetical protein [Bernardetia litoralis]AFM05447.1 hypothetical protein Fleli_3107 [Bernardetia litoralis DSM 6794]
MKLKNYKLKNENHFVAMEYYNLIMNRTFLVLILEDYLIGMKVNGLVSVENNNDAITSAITRSMSIQGDLENPYSYMKNSYLRKIENLDIYGAEILKIERANFKINRNEIESATYDERQKWGMGYYPHDGKVYIKMKNGKKKEFIIVGSQSGKEIENWINKKENI